MAGFGFANAHRLREQRDRFDVLFDECNRAIAIMTIFMDNKKIEIESAELLLATINLQSHAGTFSFKIENIYLTISYLQNKTASPEKNAEIMQLITKENGLHKEFKAEQLKMSKPIYEKAMYLRKEISTHLKHANFNSPSD